MNAITYRHLGGCSSIILLIKRVIRTVSVGMTLYFFILTNNINDKIETSIKK